MISYCIIDDEPIAHRIIEGYCTELPHLLKVGNAYNAFEASAIVTQQQPKLIFLDINMPKMTGFEWLKTLTQRPQVIVTTAYKEYALEGYELDIADYLLKPFSFVRFLKAVNRALEHVNTASVSSPSIPRVRKDCFFLKGDKKHHQIHTEEILYVEAFGNYAKIYLEKEMILSHENISALEALLGAEEFIRVHKSFIVSKAKIQLIQGNLIHVYDHKVPIGQTYRSRVIGLLNGRK